MNAVSQPHLTHIHICSQEQPGGAAGAGMHHGCETWCCRAGVPAQDSALMANTVCTQHPTPTSATPPSALCPVGGQLLLSLSSPQPPSAPLAAGSHLAAAQAPTSPPSSMAFLEARCPLLQSYCRDLCTASPALFLSHFWLPRALPCSLLPLALTHLHVPDL